jgi:NTE family protein
MSSGDFTQAARAIRIGVAAARAAAPRLRHLSLSPDAWAVWKAGRPHLAPDRMPIDAVQVTGLTWVNPALFNPLIAHQLDRPLDRPRLESDIARVYGRGDFQNINFDLKRDLQGDLDRGPRRPADPPGPTGVNRLTVNAREKPWGPGYLTAGLGLATDFQGSARLGLHGDYRRTWVNRLGAEWYSAVQLGDPLYLYTEFYQPFSLARTGFILPSAGYSISEVSVYDRRGDRMASYELTRNRIGLDLGVTLLGGNAELRVGAVLASASARLDTGDRALPSPKNVENGLRARFVYDTLDNTDLPRAGQRLELDLDSPQPVMGADLNFNRLSGHWTLAGSRGPHALVGRAMAGGAIGGEMPYYDQFAQGGFLNLSGYPTDRFRGNRAALASLIYSYRIASLTPPLGRGVYVGASVEVGAIDDSIPELTKPGIRFGSSVFLGADTWLGPAYVALGRAGDGSTAGYLMLGRP